MEQHPIPRQITTFEFKLIGFMTLKQFLYLLVFVPSAFLVYKIVPVPIINILMALAVALFGVALAFVPVQDRPLDVWIKNFLKRLRSPTQYTYSREDEPLYFLKGLSYSSDPHKVMAHIESEKKLASYLSQKGQKPDERTKEKTQVQEILEKTPATSIATAPAVDPNATQPGQPASPTAPVATVSTSTQPAAPKYDLKKIASYSLKQPFFTGVVKNNKQIPLPGVLIYVKDEENTVVRLLKTNPHGVFASYSPLPAGSYNIEIKDPNGGYFFDTMKTRIETENPIPLMFYSKELL